MQRVKLVKKLSMTCTAGLAAVPLIAASPASNDPATEKRENKLIRPSQLPIYVVDDSCATPKPCADDCAPGVLEESFGTVRRAVQGLFSEYSSVTENISTKVSTGYEHSLLMLDYLREDSNIMPRLGAVGIGGLTGLVFSLRGGRFKRLVYTSGGILSVAAVCYPKQAQESFTLAKHYANIGYNFVYGVKPGDANQLEIKWPEMPKMNVPSSASEFFDLAIDTGSSLASAVGSLASKATDAITQNTESKSEPAPKPKDH